MNIDFFQVIFFSIIQAITEFLPISSSGHLVILHNIFRDNILNNTSFDVILHGGSLLAIIIYFFKDIINVINDFFRKLLKNRNELKNDLGLLILVSMLPAAIIGYFFENIIESVFRTPIIVAIALIFGSIIFIIAEKLYKPNKNLNKLNFKSVVYIGLFQCLSFIPGISRSGITISTGMLNGLERRDAAKFSFLLAIPVMFGAFVKKILDVYSLDLNLLPFFIAFVFSFIFSIISLRILMILLKKSFGLYIFAIYRILLAILIIIFFNNIRN